MMTINNIKTKERIQTICDKIKAHQESICFLKENFDKYISKDFSNACIKKYKGNNKT